MQLYSVPIMVLPQSFFYIVSTCLRKQSLFSITLSHFEGIVATNFYMVKEIDKCDLRFQVDNCKLQIISTNYDACRVGHAQWWSGKNLINSIRLKINVCLRTAPGSYRRDHSCRTGYKTVWDISLNRLDR